MVVLLSLLALAETPADTADKPPEWKVDDAHGPAHEVALDLSEGTWMSVSVHGNTVAFDLLGDLWTLPLSGGDATRLTSGAAWDIEPRFSPDGSRIAFVSDRGGNEQIWTMKADGTDLQPLTDEKEARVTEPVWDPSGDWIVARRRTIDTRSIGVTELWQYHLQGGKGIALTKLDEHPHAGEHVVTDRHIWFSTRFGRFTYSQDPVGGLWNIQRLDRRTGTIRPVVRGAGSAVRPMLHPDGQHLIFVSRDRTKTLLEVLDFATGERRVLADWLSPDEMEGFSLHGNYPAMDWTDDGELVLWANGKLWRLTLDGTRTEIPFRAKGEWRLHDVPRWTQSFDDEVVARVIRWPVLNRGGDLAFSALGRLWVKPAGGGIRQVSEGLGYSPSWGPDGTLAWVSWTDEDGGAVQLTRKGRTRALSLKGQLVNPSFSPDGKSLVVLRAPGGGTSPDLGSESWYDLLWVDLRTETVRTVTSIGTRGSANRAPRLTVHDDRIWFFEDVPSGKPRTPSDAQFVSIQPDGTDKRVHVKFTGGGAEEVAPSPDFQWLAYKQRHQLHVTPLPHWSAPVTVAEALPDRQVTRLVGDWIAWTPDGERLTWVEGPTLKEKALADIWKKGDDGEKDEEKDYFAEEDVVSTDIGLTVPRARPTGVKALVGGTVITMKGDEIVDGIVVIDGDRISAVGPGEAPAGAEVIDISGKTVIPGFIDVHAHLHYSSGDIQPEEEWRYLVNLDFGVTTVQDPSASTDTVFTQAERVAAGFMKGPRVFSTGYVLYGALGNQGAPTPSQDAARAHVRRLKAVGARSVKVYQQSQRERRQWYVQACIEEQMLCVPEGGGDLWQNLGMVADGYHAIEHALPTAPLHADVRGLFGTSAHGDTLGTFYSPTLLVAYGGLNAEHWYHQHENPLNHERLLRHHPRRELDRRVWRPGLMAQDDDWRWQASSKDAGQLQKDGVHVTLGAHGQLQGLGVHWELWALAEGMSAHDALRAGTIEGARYLGMQADLGSIEPGKFADLVVLEANPLDDIRNSEKIAFVMKNGEVIK